MTTEEAIKTIETAISEVEWNYPMNYTVAFVMAIQALRNDCDELQQKYKDAIERQGDFGRLFVDYRGCPKGSMGRRPGPIEEEVLSMPVIKDVDGGFLLMRMRSMSWSINTVPFGHRPRWRLTSR